MYKRVVKIIILFVLLGIVVAGGYYIYKRVENKKEFSVTNIYNYISPESTEVFNINKKYGLDELFAYDTSFQDLIVSLKDDISYPVILSKSEDGNKVLIVKYNTESERNIKDKIAANASSGFTGKRKYKHTTAYFYPVGENDYIIAAFYKGLLAISKDYKCITTFIDYDTENTFFSPEQNEEITTRILSNETASLFYKIDNYMIALEYGIRNDTIDLDGYILEDKLNTNASHMDYELLLYKIDLPNDRCIEDVEIDSINKPVLVKITLNKIPDLMLNK